jgi:hypothetical protein
MSSGRLLTRKGKVGKVNAKCVLLVVFLAL